MDKTTNEKAADCSGSSEERKGTPYQRIVIACPDNHIIVVKRFMNGGKKLICKLICSKNVDNLQNQKLEPPCTA